jgi:hypothetical protein
VLAEHRRELGTRGGTRALTCWKQAVFALAWFRDRPDIRRLGAGFGISQATAYRYKDEAIEVLAAKAPTLREALDKAIEQGLPYLILDGTLVSSDRCVGKKTSKKSKEMPPPVVWLRVLAASSLAAMTRSRVREGGARRRWREPG